MTEPPMATDADMETIVNIVDSARIALLTTLTRTGELHSRPLAVQDQEFDGDLWFFTQDPSAKVEDILANPTVNVAFDSGKGYLSIAGTAEVVHDREFVERYWTPAVEAWFPNGKDDPTVALIKVDAVSAEFWASDEPSALTALKIAKAAVTHKRPDVGENDTVKL